MIDDDRSDVTPSANAAVRLTLPPRYGDATPQCFKTMTHSPQTSRKGRRRLATAPPQIGGLSCRSSETRRAAGRYTSFLRLGLCRLLVLIVTIPFPSYYLPRRRMAFWASGASETRRLDAPERAGGGGSWWWSTLPLTRLDHAHDPTRGPLPGTSVHCVGENYSPDAWKYRSCEFRDLCYDASGREFVAVESREEAELRRALGAFTARERQSITLSTLLDSARSSVSLGTASVEPWFPRVVAQEDVEGSPVASGVSLLSNEAVLVPISVSTPPQSSGSQNVIWDVLYPVYTLLSLFGLEEKQAVLLMLDPKETVAGVRRPLEVLFEHMDESMMILAPSEHSVTGSIPSGSPVPWICSKYAVAGLGLRRFDGNDVDSDDSVHDSKSFQWNTRSVAEGINLWAFRSFLMKGLRIQQGHASDAKLTPIQVTVQGKLHSQFAELRRNFPADQVQLHRFTSQEDVTAIASSISASRVLVTSVYDWREIDLGLVTFLPRDSYLLILVDNVDSFEAHSPYGMRKMDWDLLNAAGYFHIRVLPLHDSGASALVPTLRSIIDFVRNHA